MKTLNNKNKNKFKILIMKKFNKNLIKNIPNLKIILINKLRNNMNN